MNNKHDMSAFYPQGNDARSMSFPGYSGKVSNSSSVVPVVSDSSGRYHIVRDSTGAVVANSLPGSSGAHPDNGATVEWSADEQYMLQEGLVKYADEPIIIRYIKIAASLNDKTVRDVALRCKWMMLQKRRKNDEYHHARKAICGKDKLMDTQSGSNLQPAIHDAAGHSFSARQVELKERICGVSSTTAMQLLDQNRQVLEQIDANLLTKKPQNNVSLFEHSRAYFEEINTILQNLPGDLSMLQPLPPLEGQIYSSDSLPPPHMVFY